MPPTARWAKWAVLGGVVLLAGLLTLLAVLVPTSTGATRFQRAEKACGAPVGYYTADGGHTMDLDGKGVFDAAGAPKSFVDCVLAELDAPQRLLTAIETTWTLDEAQVDTWDGITATWTRRQDVGLYMLLTDR